MTNIQIIEIPDSIGNIVESVVIDNQDSTFTSMLKSTYDEQQAQQLGGN